MIIGVISDTHLPVRAKRLPEELVNRLKDVDLILHAGDFEEMNALREIQNIGEVKAVHGNMDSLGLKRELPEKVVFEAEGFKIGITHGSGPPIGLEKRVKAKLPDVDVIVYGHSHKPKNEVIGGTLFFNPGSPTDKIFAPFKSFGILKIGEEVKGDIIKF
ncbi:MAG: metallophosphoesterase family protein [Halobacteriota archaeon]|nr:metallophosphoesterase family protein [Halobacteriota archaeon]